MFDYKINNAYNGIILPYLKKQEEIDAPKFSSLGVVDQDTIAFNAMYNMKRQWHVGGHEYTIPEDVMEEITKYFNKSTEGYESEKLLRQIRNKSDPSLITNYMEAVMAKLDDINTKYSYVRCWNKRKEYYGKKFISDMNNLSREIESKLLAFETEPKDSWPFFVSVRALQFAYNIPVSLRLIVVYKKNGDLYANRYKLKRFKKDMQDLRIEPESGSEPILDDNSFTMFCSNAYCFIIADGCGFELPWRECNCECYIRNMEINPKASLDITTFLNNNKNQLTAFVGRTNIEYCSPAKTQLKRRKELL